MFERTIPWVDLATFLSRRPRVSSNYSQSEKLSKSSILPEDWAMRGMVWPGRLFERGFWDGVKGQLMEMEMLDACDPLPETLDEDGRWEDDLDGNDKPSREKPSRVTLAWRRAMWTYTKIAKVVSGFHWDGKSTWWIDGMLAEKARQWEEEDRLAREEEECRKMGRRWVILMATSRWASRMRSPTPFRTMRHGQVKTPRCVVVCASGYRSPWSFLPNSYYFSSYKWLQKSLRPPLCMCDPRLQSSSFAYTLPALFSTVASRGHRYKPLTPFIHHLHLYLSLCGLFIDHVFAASCRSSSS